METSKREACASPGKLLFLRGAGLAFGLWLLYVGTMKWIGGPSAFVGFFASKFAGTWIPHPLLLLTGWGIMCAEPLLGLWLVSGAAAQWAWLLTALFMFVLAFGMTVAQDAATVASNWHYFFIALTLAALHRGWCCCNRKEE